MISTKIINTTEYGQGFIHNFEVTGLSNLQKLIMITKNKKADHLNMPDLFGEDGFDSGWMDGSSYQDVRHSFGSTEKVELLLSKIVDLATSVDIDEEENIEFFAFMFDAGDGKSLLVSNFQENYYFDDYVLNEDEVPGVLHIVAGGTTDDLDVGCLISHMLVSHPLTKGFKVINDESFCDFFEDIPNWDDFIDYCGHAFGGANNKKSDEFFDMFKACNRLVLQNPEIFQYRSGSTSACDTILGNYEYCKDIPDQVRLEYHHNTSNKFYNVEMNNLAVLIEYGAIGKGSTCIETDFQTLKDAKKFMNKKVISKIKSGYTPVEIVK